MVEITRTKAIDWRLFTGLLVAAIGGQVAALPYICSLFDFDSTPLPVPLPLVLTLQVVQGAVMAAVAVLLGLLLAGRCGLGLPLVQGWLDGQADRTRLTRTATLSIGLGALAGVAIFVLDRYIFAILVEPITVIQGTPPLWQRFGVCFYGGINEEIFLRLFLLTLLVWLWSKVAKQPVPPAVAMWSAIVIVSIVFGLGHLPMTARFVPLTSVVVVRALVLNGLAGVIFGWLYWRRGLEASMVAHFVTDVVLHVVLPLAA